MLDNSLRVKMLDLITQEEKTFDTIKQLNMFLYKGNSIGYKKIKRQLSKGTIIDNRYKITILN